MRERGDHPPRPVDSLGVEDIDRQILRLLAADGRMSYTDLGRATGLSTSAVHQRVRKLEERGVIRGYSAVLDPVAVGLPLTAFVSAIPLDPAAPDDGPDSWSPAAIEACYSVAGEESYILKVRVPSPADLETLLAEIRAAPTCAPARSSCCRRRTRAVRRRSRKSSSAGLAPG